MKFSERILVLNQGEPKGAKKGANKKMFVGRLAV
jgi:hypothetical protein